MKYDYPSPNVKGGYLKRGENGWAIQPALVLLGESFVHVSYARAEPIIGGHGRQTTHQVYVQPAVRAPNDRGPRGARNLTLDMAESTHVLPCVPGGAPPPGFFAATLVVSGHMAGQHPKHWHCAIYEPDPNATLIPIPNEMWRLYQDDCDMPRGPDTQTRRLEKNDDALFYLLDGQGNLVYFGPTMLFRLPYSSTPFDLVPADMHDVSKTDLAEAIFGYVPVDGDKREARAGRVFVTDACLYPPRADVWLSDQTQSPKILSSPKPTSFQHYLTQQEPDDERKLDHYADSSPHERVIRGHKLYWHQDDVGAQNIMEDAHVARDERFWKQHTLIRPVKAEAQFHFQVRFESLTKVELGALLWALTLPGQKGATYYHKLGMAKSLGMGAVHIQPTLFRSERMEPKSGRYAHLFKPPDAQRSAASESDPAIVWHLAESKVEDFQSYINAFETYTLAHMHATERGPAQHLCELSRIQMLLRMLQWPGPPREKTQTMAVTSFKRRPVLPDPLHVWPPPSNTRTGTLKKFDPLAGKGLIVQDDGTQIVIQPADVAGPGCEALRAGLRVQYTLAQGQNGRLRALNLRPV
jgi:cold shock CspA family protein